MSQRANLHSGRTKIFIAIAVPMALAAALVAQLDKAGAGPQLDVSGGKAVAHRAGGTLVESRAAKKTAPDARLHNIGLNAIEPTLGLTEDGSVFYTAFQSNTRVEIVRSQDEGATWEVVSPQFPGGVNAQLLSLDPYIWVDEWTDRVYTIDLTVACSYLSYTDDLGESWTTNPLACGRPVNDHQTLFGGPPVNTTLPLYDNVVYYCFNDTQTSTCSRSLDGGISFVPTAEPPYHPLDATSEGTVRSCGGLHGHGVVGADGTVYLPKEHCEEPWLAISKDEGDSWTRVRVSPGTAIFGPDPSVAVDGEGNIYYVYIDTDRLPYLVTSVDGGKDWSEPLMIAAPGLTEVVHATIDAGSPGGVAIAYYGTDDVTGPVESRSYGPGVRWDGYITMTNQGLSPDPLFYSGTVNDPVDPFAVGPCGPRRCQDAIDFIDVVVGPDGTPWASFADSCKACGGPPQATGGIVGRLFGGPSLR